MPLRPGASNHAKLSFVSSYAKENVALDIALFTHLKGSWPSFSVQNNNNYMCTSTECSTAPCRHTFEEPQQFHLIAPILQQRQAIQLISKAPNASTPSFYDIFLDEPTDWVWSTLARPVPLGELFNRTSLVQLPPSSPSMLEKMPNELLYLIIERVPESRDIIAFGLSSKQLWPLVVNEVQSRYSRTTAPWAGKKIAFTGTWIDRMPQPFFENDGHGTFNDVFPSLHTMFYGGFAGFYHLDGFKQWRMPESMYTQKLEYQKAIVDFLPDANASAKSNLGGIFDFMKYFPQDRVWLLRNLKTRQYISSEALINGLSFHHILLSQISFIHGHDGFGNYAGHRFDIVMKEVHDEETQKDAGNGPRSWKDISSGWSEWADTVRRRFLLSPARSGTRSSA